MRLAQSTFVRLAQSTFVRLAQIKFVRLAQSKSARLAQSKTRSKTICGRLLARGPGELFSPGSCQGCNTGELSAGSVSCKSCTEILV